MKKILLLFTLLISSIGISQTQPTIHNGTFNDIPKSSGSDCSCAGWINKDIADAGEDSTTGGSEVVKFDNVESDGIYQEVAVEANSNYTLTLSYINSIVASTTTTTNLEVYILKGSTYFGGYTPAYNPPLTADQDDLGYRTIAAVETAGNQITKALFAPAEHTSASIASVSFNTGTETSIAIFVRAIGPYNAAAHGDMPDDKGWMNGDSEIRIDNLTLVNNGLTVSYAPTQPTVHNGTFNDIPKSSGSDCSCAGWINKDIADAGEDSTTGGSEVVKFDNVESDGIYQEVAVEANSNYTLTLNYINSIVASTTTTTNLEVYILKGSTYFGGYTPAYNPPLTADQDDLGYRTIAAVETAGNQIKKALFAPAEHTSVSIASVSFDTGTETSIAIFVRAIGPYNAAAHGDMPDDKGWMNGDSEIRIDNLTLVNNGYSNNVWQGGSTTWASTGNWGLNTLPTEFNRVIVGSTGTNPIIGSSTGAKAYNLNVNSSATLNISSGGSLIVTDASIGDVTYNVGINDTNWHLLSSPVVGETYNTTWVNDNDIDNTSRTVGTNVGIATYINTTDADGDWTYTEDTDTGNLTNGQGYSIKRDATTNPYISFTGTVKTNDLTGSIDQGFGALNKWNLKGNPYPAYILVSDLITDNTANLTSTHKNVYVFDNNKAGGAGYSALELTDYIYPGQGFFLNADNSTADNFTIDASKLSHQTSETLFKTSNNLSINLFIEEGSKKQGTEINYLVGKTTGLDPSYDVGTFTGQSTGFNIYTQLISNNEGVNFMKQALPNYNFENMVIPVGVKAAAGKEITFSAEVLNLPSGIKVFLEDRVNNTFTRLDETNSNYKVTLKEALNGIGRFYIHTVQSALSISDAILLETVSIYKLNKSTLRIAGLPQGKANMKLFNILGKELMDISFESNGIKVISLSKLVSGIHIIQLETTAGKLNKKIILE